ncbi:predicted protein [Botrytis cinerea T4]|uniref:Uncharacterized protein n=1 Tax=Botryotinia fuckeliana (strain T4) TaxID=999810 RepID=G2YBS1_BOTF4|nr:predicted protein [Botrytis cinerea T4]
MSTDKENLKPARTSTIESFRDLSQAFNPVVPTHQINRGRISSKFDFSRCQMIVVSSSTMRIVEKTVAAIQ